MNISLTLLFILCLSILLLCTSTPPPPIVVEKLDNNDAREPNSWVHTECISLENCGQRRVDLLGHMRGIGFRPRHFKFSKATTPDTIKQEYQPYKEFIKDTRLACWLSHINVWKRYRHHAGPVLVIEDDVRFEPGFTTKLNNIAKVLDMVDWDICMLGRSDVDSPRDNVSLNMCDLEIIKNDFIQMHCYLFNPRHLDKLLQVDPVNMGHVKGILDDFTNRDRLLAIDTYMPHLLKLGRLNVLGVKTQLAHQISTDTYGSTTN